MSVLLAKGTFLETAIASAATCDIGALNTVAARVTGSTTITSFGTAANRCFRIVRFAAALTLTHHGTSLILPGAANITTAADDQLFARSDASGNWRVVIYQRKSGKALIGPDAADISDISATGTSLITAANPGAVRTLLDLAGDLTAIAALATTSYGRALLTLANDAALFAMLSFSANGISLVQAANYPAMKALLDLEAGTDFYSIAAADAAFQPKDGDLTLLAALNTDAFGRGLLEKSTALLAREYIEAPRLIAKTSYTPVFTFSTTEPTGLTYAAQSGFWSAAEDIVKFKARVSLTSKGTGGVGNLRISLPTAPTASGDETPVSINAWGIDWSTNYTQILARVADGPTYVEVLQGGDNQALNQITWDMLTATSAVFVAGCYLK